MDLLKKLPQTLKNLLKIATQTLLKRGSEPSHTSLKEKSRYAVVRPPENLIKKGLRPDEIPIYMYEIVIYEGTTPIATLPFSKLYIRQLESQNIPIIYEHRALKVEGVISLSTLTYEIEK